MVSEVVERDAEIVMPVKDLVGRPRLTPEEAAFRDEMVARLDRMRRPRRDGSDDGEPLPVGPPSGPAPLPLAGAAELDDDC